MTNKITSEIPVLLLILATVIRLIINKIILIKIIMLLTLTIIIRNTKSSRDNWIR